MKLYEHWQMDYRADRYLEYLSEADLKQRTKDVLANVLAINNDGKIGPHSPAMVEGQYWMRRWTEALEEFQMRFGPYPGGFTDGSMKSACIPNPADPIVGRAIKIIKGKNLEVGTYLAKYGAQEHLIPVLKEGKVRISPASFYRDPSLNHAIRDDELSCSVHLHPSKVALEAIDPLTGKSKGRLTPTSNVTIKFGASTNYYVYCVSTVLLPRLFVDFSADSCLLITNPPQFLLRLTAAADKQLPGWDKYLIRVTYFDPLRPDKKQIDSSSCKHFRFAYQKEWRVIWSPSKKADKLDHVHVDIGNCEDVCELIVP